MNVRRLERLESPRGIGVLAEMVGVSHRDARGTDSLVGPDGVQHALENRQVPFRERRHLALDLFEDVYLRLVAKLALAICFIVISPTPFFHATSSALLSGESLSSQGAYWSMIASTMPGLGRGLDHRGAGPCDGWKTR